MFPFDFPSELALSLKELSQREGATLFMALLGAFYVLLHRYTRQDDLIIGTLSPCGRKHSGFQQCMGYFLNPVALRANLSGTANFRSLLRQMREVTLGAISNDDVTLEMIAERLQVSRDPSRNLFFDVALSLAPDVAPLPPGWSMTYMDVESGGARWDLYIEFNDRADALLGRAQYNPDLFTPEMMSQTIADFRGLLEEIVALPDLPIVGT
jgi:non-ribosomal peptide synthetase component F